MTTLCDRYIDLLKAALLNDLQIELEAQVAYAVLCASHDEVPDLDKLQAMRSDRNLLAHLSQLKRTGEPLLLKGLDDQGVSRPDERLYAYTQFAHSTLGRERLEHLQACVESLLDQGIEGGILQAGCRVGGTAVFLRGLLHAYGTAERVVWQAADWSGSGSTPTDARQSGHSKQSLIALFKRYGLMNEGVRFIEGNLSDTLHNRPSGPLALLHIDTPNAADVSSVLHHCHDRVSAGGFIVVDHCGNIPACREAVDFFRSQLNDPPSMSMITGQAACWRV